ncbi:hypothetical protein V6N12_062428 [Hibiscus sabdariffa]|uniref:Uncharacterized protein n=1 Tax=Hibiscus sabdariffa TaxID=183260 RepID=A0ABR2F8V7_9ROSI
MEKEKQPVKSVVTGLEWRVKSGLNLSASEAGGLANVAGEVVVVVDAMGEIGSSVGLAGVEVVRSTSPVEAVVVALNDVRGEEEVASTLGENVAILTDDFPPLESPDLTRGRGRGATFVGSKNKFEVLAATNIEMDEPRKPRNASLGVAALMQELKGKKAGKLKAKGSRASCSNVLAQ